MLLTEKSLKNPAAMMVLVAIALLLGVITLTKLPVQLFPNIERPQIGIQTFWRSASPSEIESEIIEPIEEVMQGIPGLEELRTFSNSSNGFVSMEFSLETDMDRMLIEIISRLNRLPPLPADADRPQIVMNGGDPSGETLIYLFTQFRADSALAREDYISFIEDNVRPRLEAVEGIAQVNLEAGSGLGDQLQIEFDPVRAAELGIDLNNITRRVGRTTDSSGGYLDVGRRRYLMNFQGKYEPDELRALILDWRDGRPITLGDVATISVGPAATNQVVYQNGSPAISMRVIKESGANVLAAIDRLTAVVDELNETVLKEQGIAIEKSFDPSVFINRAINLLSGNLLIGVLLSVGVLWWFLRQVRATLLIALTIPVCLLTTIVVLGLFGRTVNVISLAGLAFATGMVLDAAIVVLENIVRLREKGEKPNLASLKGAGQVWGALLASTATTVAIFVPILFLKDVEGQLFADLALTIAIGVALSLIVAVTVLPVAAKYFLKALPPSETAGERAKRFASRLMIFSSTPVRRGVMITGLMAGAISLSWLLLPNLNYLPPVKRDAVDAFLMFPSGANMETIDEEVVSVIVDRLQPYMDGVQEPALKNYYFITFPGGQGGSLGVRAKDQGNVKELERLVREEILVGFPDVFTFAQQGNLFGNFGGNGSVELNIQARDLEQLREVTVEGQRLISEALPGAQARPNPDPNVIAPELQITPNDRRLAEVGYTRADISRIIRALGDGLWLGEHFDGEQRVDMILKAQDWSDPESLRNVPLATPLGGTVPLGDLVTIERGVGPTFIQRLNRKRNVSLNITQPEGMPLEDMIAILKRDVEPKLKEMLPVGATISYGGSADALDRAVASLSLNFVLALGLLFLILAALFKSPKDAMLVVITIPLATVGGVIALKILNIFSFAPLDLLTMIGFIILLGLVVNNAILLVAQTRQGEADGLSREDAVERALGLRMRPIFMSTLTSIMGMLPLVLFPGAGSAIYRGMATTIVGGMTLSTVFTLLLLPCLLRVEFFEQIKRIFTKPQTNLQPAE
ncbi:efflux RND transporter permease subunit [Kordiimonas sp. SCSIO 12610]|uniref:efflux RND transporter permease subunit n=1 Tax=Kordiimonas sp. SCSIO 12610 TaxID=2829597 RepID=UPI00210E4662|nr:efflux RND transporter permease subunit [Kordiimonas sp. SCSIO 12610]UTW54995.1 efflux RND transporter permease subunit [Kordiimonas sp. SCSIO 12610]